MNTRLAAIAVCLIALILPALAQQEVVIEAFESSGQLVFDRVTNASGYRVEWAPTADGPWTSFTGQAGQWLGRIPNTGSGLITASVPTVYRVVVMPAIPAIDFVTVGGAGNQADSVYGAVAYEYQIGKYEVTNEQYVEFLNAVAASDPNGLFNTTTDPLYHIERSGCDGSYSYRVEVGWENNPVNYVSFFDAMRFVNWLENGGSIGGQDNTTTEMGTYTIGSGTNETRAAGAMYFLPSENEWYKAAHYTGSGYTIYPTTNGVPTAEVDANYGGTGGTYSDTWRVGTGTAENNGTFDMGGNVSELNEAVIGSSRGLRGGSWLDISIPLRSSNRGSLDPSSESYSIGFRVARLP